VRPAAILGAAALAAGLAAASAAGAPARPVQVTVVAAPGAERAVARGLGAGGLRIARRDGRRLQVLAAPARRAGLARLPGVAAAHVAPAAFADEDPEESIGLGAPSGRVVSEGLDRTGALGMQALAGNGRGLVIAVLDLGFGAGLEARLNAGELPPADRLETRSFDQAAGLAGTNAYGNATNHGELVAQTVYDYAPEARYLFVNYHSEQDFQAAVDFLVARRPDIVVHSNSFIEGPFDGTGAAARAVDRAAAAGILWVNSAGNYGERHWTGTWADADRDGALDWPGDPGWTFARQAGQPISFALSWPSPRGAEPPDVDLLLQRQEGDGTWATVAQSADRQSQGAGPAERVIGHLPALTGVYRVRAVLVSGPPPEGPLVMFSREIAMTAIGGAPQSSVPTPGDAVGSLTVGAVDWRGNRPKAYSSQGPTDDGRLKPDVVAPTNTRLAGPNGPREVGGTSNAAPNAAGVAAVVMGAQRAAGITPSAQGVRDLLGQSALDLGEPGPDQAFGAGRVRAETDPPLVTPSAPGGGLPVRGVVRLLADAEDASRIASWSLALDGVPLARGTTDTEPAARVDTRRLADGPHQVAVQAADWPGNQAQSAWTLVVDNSRPVLRVRRVDVSRPPRTRVATARTAAPRVARPRPVKPRPRGVRVLVSARDRGPLRLEVRLRAGSGRVLIRRSLTTRPTAARALPMGRLLPGDYRLTLTATDRAGNVSGTARTLRVR
jgi:hypothetical protein